MLFPLSRNALRCTATKSGSHELAYILRSNPIAIIGLLNASPFLNIYWSIQSSELLLWAPVRSLTKVQPYKCNQVIPPSVDLSDMGYSWPVMLHMDLLNYHQVDRRSTSQEAHGYGNELHSHVPPAQNPVPISYQVSTQELQTQQQQQENNNHKPCFSHFTISSHILVNCQLIIILLLGSTIIHHIPPKVMLIMQLVMWYGMSTHLNVLLSLSVMLSLWICHTWQLRIQTSTTSPTLHTYQICQCWPPPLSLSLTHLPPWLLVVTIQV